MTKHNIVMVGSLVLVGVMGALNALQGHGLGDFTTILAILGLVEHALGGNTGTTA